ncbi:MAG: hypothetical protein LBQ12_12725 [Deltaproteobacteria bacterium]|nr:hypothetical protein [Deltaproteobacteria bacterium]
MAKDSLGFFSFNSNEFYVLFEDRFDDTLESLKANGELPPGIDADDLKAKKLERHCGYNWHGN